MILQLEKKIIVCLLLIGFFNYSGQTNYKFCFYNDTTFEFNGFIITLKNIYTQNRSFLKTDVEFINPSNNFILLNPKDIYLTSKNVTHNKSRYKKTIVIPPSYSKKFSLKFPSISVKDSTFELDFSKIKLTKNVLSKAATASLKVMDHNVYQAGNIKAEIIDTKVDRENIVIRLKIWYQGENFLVVNYNNIAVITGNADTCYNLKKPIGKFHINPNTNTEVVSLTFPKSCLTLRDKKTILFENVFTEMSLDEFSGFKINLTQSKNSNAIFQTQDDIELID